MDRNTPKYFFWVDLEMTGLDPVKDRILEVGIVITDLNLKPLEEFHRIVYQPQAFLDQMDDFCQKLHGNSGLTKAVQTGTPQDQVESEILALAARYFGPNERIVLAGNSVGNDKRFIDQHMHKLAARLHYRIIDVSSFKEVLHTKHGLTFEKKKLHRATDDIYESIQELTYYLSFFSIPK
jgi:oligoribonuclease